MERTQFDSAVSRIALMLSDDPDDMWALSCALDNMDLSPAPVGSASDRWRVSRSEEGAWELCYRVGSTEILVLRCVCGELTLHGPEWMDAIPAHWVAALISADAGET